MRILISQIEYVKPPRNFVFDALERSYYKFLSGHELIPAPNTDNVAYNDYDCLLLTGGPDSVARNKTENKLYHDAVSKGKPIIGICHGAFAINDICKGVNGNVEGHVDTDIKIEMEGYQHTVKCYHSQSIEKLAENFTAIAHDEQGTIEAFQHDTLPIYGIVWHPERMDEPVLPAEVKKLLD
jgi:gamma-glutamyl-gamma-aminobutyrate hydrolase PuuD